MKDQGMKDQGMKDQGMVVLTCTWAVDATPL